MEALLKKPSPALVHKVEEAPVAAPFKVVTGLLAQTLWLGPALEVGAGKMNKKMVSLTGGQVPPVVVKVKAASPPLISPAEGV